MDAQKTCHICHQPIQPGQLVSEIINRAGSQVRHFTCAYPTGPDRSVVKTDH